MPRPAVCATCGSDDPIIRLNVGELPDSFLCGNAFHAEPFNRPAGAHSRARMMGEEKTMQGFVLQHTGNGFFIRLEAGQRTVDLLAPQICGACGCWVDRDLTPAHRKKCKMTPELEAKIESTEIELKSDT
jgi:hypothetical protein